MMLKYKIAFNKYKYKIVMIQICMFVLLVDNYGQTYISPQVGLAYNTISNNYGHQSLGRTVYLQDIEESYSVGLQASHSISNRLEGYLSGRFERLETMPNAVSELGDREDGTTIATVNEFNPRGIIFRRIHLSLGFGYEFVPNLSLISSVSLVQIMNTKRLQQTRWQHLVEDQVLDSDDLEAYLELSVSYQYRSISIAPFYRYGFWHNDGVAPDEIDPVSALGLRLGYRFKIFNKIKQKSKVVCPEL